MQIQKNEKALRDVKCSVKSCHFNDSDGKCRAEAIEVSPCSGTGCEGTLCATFVDRDKCGSCY